jgi:regulator of CtrA degradation
MVKEDQAKAIDRGGPVVFSHRFAQSETFREVFREGMALVEETAAYLDGDGRRESKALSRIGGLTYATESMRLTSRLMQLASWLLLQRAVNEGEMHREQARQERSKVRLQGFDSPMGGPGWTDLPVKLRDLVARSMRLQERLRLLDDGIYRSGHAPSDNPVVQQLGRLKAAFGSRGS